MSRCAICGKPSAEAFTPFCSARCRQVDLNRWFTGAYAVPAQDDEPGLDDDEATQPPATH